jgi:outer membrane immunogenic protein
MRIDLKAHAFLLLTVIAALTSGFTANAQAIAKANDDHHPELALEYNFVRSNGPPSGCGCFHLNGGSVTFAWPEVHGHLAIVADLSVIYGGSILGSNQDLTLTAVTGGTRYMPSLTFWHIQPFGQALIGLAHSSGSITQANASTGYNLGTVFAANLGGGADLPVSRRFAMRLIDAEYLVTTFANGGSNHQNNLRLGAGLVVRW